MSPGGLVGGRAAGRVLPHAIQAVPEGEVALQTLQLQSHELSRHLRVMAAADPGHGVVALPAQFPRARSRVETGSSAA